MGDKLFDFTVKWILALPYAILEKNKHKVIRALGLLLTMPWTFIAAIPSFIIMFIAAIMILVKEA